MVTRRRPAGPAFGLWNLRDKRWVTQRCHRVDVRQTWPSEAAATTMANSMNRGRLKPIYEVREIPIDG